jgi:hypothetical protein
MEESADGGGLLVLDSDDEGVCDWARRPNEARYDLASLRDGFERNMDMMKSCSDPQDGEEKIRLFLHYPAGVDRRMVLVERDAHRVQPKKGGTVHQKSKTETYCVESLKSMGALRF